MQIEILAKLTRFRDLGPAYDPDRIQGYCQTCRNQGKNWSCPPLVQKLESLIGAREDLMVLAYKLNFSQAEIQASSLAAKDWFKDPLISRLKLAGLESLFCLEQLYPGSKGLAFGACELCQVCSRSRQEPCLRPGQLRYSLEALGYDVGWIIKQELALDLVWADQGLPPYLIFVGGLMLDLGLETLDLASIKTKFRQEFCRRIGASDLEMSI